MIKAHKVDTQSPIINAMGICCPVCGDDYIHFLGYGTNSPQLAETLDSVRAFGGPGLSISFYGECGSEFALLIKAHKGNMLLEGRIDKSCRLDYHEYIKSDEWKIKASAAKQSAGWRCQVCNRSHHEAVLDAHHRTYERLGHERPDDITVLCRDCHELYETNRKARRNGGAK